MPTTPLKLTNMSAKYLVDFLSHSGWARGHEDVYRAGQMLADVLPRFGDGEKKGTPADGTPVAELPWPDIQTPEAPVPPAQLPDGNPDWSRMSRAEADEFRLKIKVHNQAFLTWCRKPLEKAIELTDKQFEAAQRAIKYYAPRSDEDKQKDREKQIPARPELPNNEFTFRLLRELKLGAD